MFLYEIPQDSKLRLFLANIKTGKTQPMDCTFDHIDGMYGYITVDGTMDVVHFSRFTPMVEIGQRYEIDERLMRENEATDDHFDVTDPYEPDEIGGNDG